MRVVILGSGVIGVTSAYYLAQAGHDVTVLDRQPGPALETSFANAGQISPGYASPWAAPGIPLKAMKWMLQRHAPLSITPDGTLFQLQWMWQMLQNCNAERYAVNKERMVRVAEYSRVCLQQPCAPTWASSMSSATGKAPCNCSAPRSPGGRRCQRDIAGSERKQCAF